MQINKNNKRAASSHGAVHIRSLKVFYDVVRRRSFSLAASDHGMTQSAASQSVQHLEDFLSVQLIDRTKRPFVLTAEGQKFYDGLSGVLRQFDSLVDEVRLGGSTSGEDVHGHVLVASIYSMGLSYLPILQDKFQKQYPSATFASQLAHPHEVYRMVEQGSVDFGMVSYPEQNHPTLQTTLWRHEPMILVASPLHRLSSLGRISPQALNQVGLVAFASNLRIRQEIDKELRNLGVTMRVAVELDNLDSVKHAAIVNTGVAFLPMLTVQNELAAGSLKLIECDRLELTRPLGIIQRRDVSMSRAARSFLDLIMKNRLWDQENFSSSDSDGFSERHTELYSTNTSDTGSSMAAR
ncbi:MAG: LysR family transcriptional regulator [Pirellula sp.]